MDDLHTAWHAARASRDPRFDGVFFIGVTSTKIYCRPICPAKTAKAANIRFFDSAERAEKQSFRPCLRCRPELAPGNAPVDDAHRIAHALVHHLDGSRPDYSGLEAIAAQFSLSSRQIRRIIQNELGVSPIELVQTRRLLLAKQLLTETALSITQIAFASGFASLRRFNDAFSTRYRMPPTRLRTHARNGTAINAASDSSTVQLNYRAPYDWQGILAFLAARTLTGVESVDGESYRRTVQLGEHTGWICVRNIEAKHALSLEFSHSLTPVLPVLLGRVRSLFDLSARPDLISAHFARDKVLKPMAAKNPGLRVPGAFDGFELAVRAILGQQISVKAATTLAGRFVDAFGERTESPFPGLQRLAPVPGRVAKANVDQIARLGIVGARAKSIITIARAFASGELRLDAGVRPEAAIAQLVEYPGIGPWTAHYIAMRALRWTDAFVKEDIVIRNNLGGITARDAEQMSLAWRPWRSYAVMHIWRNPSRKAPPA